MSRYRAFLEHSPRPTRRQRAKALLLLNEDRDPSLVAQIVGISKTDVEELARRFETDRIASIKRTALPKGSLSSTPDIEKTTGVCGGSARIAGTRIPVWQLVAARSMGVSEAQILNDYPALRAKDLVNAWSYAECHSDEIAAEIHENEVA